MNNMQRGDVTWPVACESQFARHTREGLVITHELYDAQGKNTKFIPVFFSRPDSQHVPSVLHASLRVDPGDGQNHLSNRSSSGNLLSM